ncbi:ABC transporter ATP-binding protein [bacterium]|nr:ABC transporter ATP-binding protein [bacterium]
MDKVEPLFQCKNLAFHYPLGTVEVPALHALDLTLSPGQMTCFAGPSGSGKSTLLRILGLIEPIQTGDVLYRGTSLKGLSEKQKNQIRRTELGFIFQHFVLFDTLTAVENVEYFLKHRGFSAKEKRERALNALNAVGLGAQARQRPRQMSGGQRQRVAIARALAKDPRVIIADEPTASLDQATGQQIMSLLSELGKTQGVTVVLASHDPMAMSFAQQIVRLKDGHLQAVESRSKLTVAPAAHVAPRTEEAPWCAI